MIELTDAAISKAVERTSRAGKTDIRLGVTGGGCAGYKYVIELADHIGENDILIDYGKFGIVVDKDSIKFLKGSRLDWVREGLNEQFKIINPNEGFSCGCGVSVTF